MALLVFVGCYLGALVDNWLRFPGAGAAVIFAPYAILTVALVRSPPRKWWIYMLAAAAGDFLPHRAPGASVSFVLMTEGANFLRAGLAAAGLRRFRVFPDRFHTLSGMLAFLLVAVIGAPAVGALAGTSIVLAHGLSRNGWLVWQEWALSNAITALTLLPLIAMAAQRISVGPGPRRAVAAPRAVELAGLSLGLLTVGAFVFGGLLDTLNVHPARLFWPLPFLLWAAVRFGPLTTVEALLGVTALSIWGAVQQRGPFAAQSPTQNLLELQMFVLGLSLPLLLLAAAFKEQQRTAAALAVLEAQRSLQDALREADRRKDEFLATLGHELRNPLAPMALALELLRAKPPESREAIWAKATMARQLRHMTRLLDDLLDISRITFGKIRLQLELVDLADVVKNAVDTARPLIDSSGHQVTVTVPDAPVRLRGDPTRLTQIAGNLLNNAVKYTPRGGHIQISARREGGHAFLSVRDNGIGIPAESLEEVFDLFTQVPSARERAPGGLGIGLTLVKRLVELHEGTVEARSSAGETSHGTEIVVRLPALDASSSQDAGVGAARSLTARETNASRTWV